MIPECRWGSFASPPQHLILQRSLPRNVHGLAVEVHVVRELDKGSRTPGQSLPATSAASPVLERLARPWRCQHILGERSSLCPGDEEDGGQRLLLGSHHMYSAGVHGVLQELRVRDVLLGPHLDDGSEAADLAQILARGSYALHQHLLS